MSISLTKDFANSRQDNLEKDDLEYSHVFDATESVIMSEPHQFVDDQNDTDTSEASSSNVQSMLLSEKRKRFIYSDIIFVSSDSSYTRTSTTSAYTSRSKNFIAQKIRVIWEAYQDLHELDIFEIFKIFRLRFLRRRREHLREFIAKIQKKLNNQMQVMALLQQEIEVLKVTIDVSDRYNQKNLVAQKKIERLSAKVKTRMSEMKAFLRDVKTELQETSFLSTM